MFNYQINNFNDYLKAQKQRDEYIRQAEIEYTKELNSKIVHLNLNAPSDIINKLHLLIKQSSNSTIATAEKNKASSLDEVYKSRNNLLDEQESILGILTSNLNQKKKVTKVTLACSEAAESDKYLAYLGENGTSYCLVLTEKNNIDLAKRYLAIFSELDKLVELKESIIENFKKTIKDYDYVENDFSYELRYIEKISKFDSLFDLEDLDPEKYYQFIVPTEDYPKLKEQLIEIQNLKKQLDELINK